MKVRSEEQDDKVGGSLTSHARVECLEPEDDGVAQVERLTSQPRVEHLAQHVKGELTAPCNSGGKPCIVTVNAGSGVTPISEGLVACLQRTHPREVLVKPFRGSTLVQTSFREERDVM